MNTQFHIHSLDIDKIQFPVDCWLEEALSSLQYGPLPRATDNMVSGIYQNEEERTRGDKQIRNWSLLQPSLESGIPSLDSTGHRSSPLSRVQPTLTHIGGELGFSL